jgi:Group II intron, maturase-specific domain
LRLVIRHGEILITSRIVPWETVRDRLNQLLRGWAAYFAYGTRLMAYRAARPFLASGNKLESSHGASSMSIAVQ